VHATPAPVSMKRLDLRGIVRFGACITWPRGLHPASDTLGMTPRFYSEINIRAISGQYPGNIRR